MKILFMGTPDIAAESLAALIEAGHEICAVFTRRDKPVGRKQILTAPPVKQLAEQHGIPVYQPRTLRDGSSDELIRGLAPDIIVVGAKTLVTALEKLQAGALKPQPQQAELATLAPPLNKDMAKFSFAQEAAHIHNWVRGMNPWPVAWFEQDGKRIKVLECRIAREVRSAAPGTVLALKPLTIAAADGAVELLTVTPEGGKPMAGTAWAAGRRLKVGDSL